MRPELEGAFLLSSVIFPHFASASFYPFFQNLQQHLSTVVKSASPLVAHSHLFRSEAFVPGMAF